MRKHGPMIQKRLFFGLALGCTLLLLVLFTGCGNSSSDASSSTGGSSNTNTSANGGTPSGCSGQSSTTGTVQNTSSGGFTVTTQNAGNVQIAYSNMTLAIRQVQGSLSDLQQGAFVRVAVKQNADKIYTAIVIVVMGSLPSSPGGGSGSSGGLGGMNGGSGNTQGGGPGAPSGNLPPPGTPGGTGGNSGSSGGLSGGPSCNVGPQDPTNGHPTISGTVGSLSGKQLTILDASKQPAGTVVTTNATQVVKMDSVSADTLQAGMKVNVTSTQGSDGKLTALALTILL